MKNSTATILLLISIGLFYTFTSPQYAAVKEIRAEADEYRRVLDGADKISEKSYELEAEYRRIPMAELDRLDKALPSNIHSVRLALDLDSIAARYGITLKNVQVDQLLESGTGVINVGSTPYEKVNVTITFTSNYSNFTRFLTDLEKSLRISNVRSIYFLPGDGGLYDHRLTIETYWLK